MKRSPLSLISAIAFLAHASIAAATPATGFQPGFHQALRWSESTGAPTTFRLRVPVGRGGTGLKLSFRAGAGTLQLSSVNVARAGADGALASTPVPVSFHGSAQASLSAHERLTSDPVPFVVGRGEELFVSFVAQGELATSAILTLPGSYAWPGSQAAASAPPADSEWYRAIGLMTIDVEGPMDRAFVALGDSITEGYVGGDTWTYSGHSDDYRNAWPIVAQRKLGLPFANAGVSGQGVYEALQHLDAEVMVLGGITDCVVLIGTNDLQTDSPSVIEEHLAQLTTKLTPFCRVWLATLTPKEIQASAADRAAVNAWIRGYTGAAGILDFEKVLAGVDADHFAEGMNIDWVHPSIAGQAALGEYTASVFLAARIDSVQPNTGSTSGGAVVTVNGAGFQAGARVLFAGVEGTVLSQTDAAIQVRVPPKAEGMVTVTVQNVDGSQATLANGFTYVRGPVISSCAPSVVPASTGAEVVVNGSGFGNNATVLIDGKSLVPESVSGVMLATRLPAGSEGPRSVTVINTQGQSATMSDCVIYSLPPSIRFVSPNAVTPGTAITVTIDGENFGAAPTVRVAEQTARITSHTSSTIIADVPALATGSYDVTVTKAEGLSVTAAHALTVGTVTTTNSADPEPVTAATAAQTRRVGCQSTPAPPLLLIVALLLAARRRRHSAAAAATGIRVPVNGGLAGTRARARLRDR